MQELNAEIEEMKEFLKEEVYNPVIKRRNSYHSYMKIKHKHHHHKKRHDLEDDDIIEL